MSRRKIWWEKVLPAVLFPSLSAISAYFMLGLLLKSDIKSKLDAQCPRSTAFVTTPFPYRLEYTSIGILDENICGIVVFFHSLLSPSNLPFATELFASLPIYITIPYFEAARNDRNIALAFPVIIGLLYQFFSMGFILPFYWLAFIWTGSASFHSRPGCERRTKVDQAHAEGILFGLFVGYLIPTIGMIVLTDPYVTAIWQLFPVWMTISQWAHRLFRPSSQFPYSGYPTVRATYIVIFIIASSYHIGIVWPRFRDIAALKHLFLPSSTFLVPADTTLELGVLEFTKWDAGIGCVSTALVTLWFSRSVKELVLLVAWHVIATAIIGPCAAATAVFMWREALLDTQRAVEAKVKGDK